MTEATTSGDEPTALDEPDESAALDDIDEDDDLDLVDDDPDLLLPAPQRWRRRTAAEMVISGLVGLFASFVLSIDAWQLASDPNAYLSCDINSVLRCGAVAATWQAAVLHFPNAFLGIFFETVVLVLSVSMWSGVRFPRWIMVGAQLLYSIGLCFALWLFSQSYFVIHALCPWCLLITFTTTLVWAGLTRINVRERNVSLAWLSSGFVVLVGWLCLLLWVLPKTGMTWGWELRTVLVVMAVPLLVLWVLLMKHDSSPRLRRFIAGGYDWYVTGAFCLLLIAMLIVRYGGSLFSALTFFARFVFHLLFS